MPESFVEIVVGLLPVILLSIFVESILDTCIRKPKKPECLDATAWTTLIEGFGSGFLIGLLESTLFFISFRIMQVMIIVAWLAFKITAKWEVWKNIIKIPESMTNIPSDLWFDARRTIGGWLYSRFLVGTLLNVIIGAGAAYISLHTFEFFPLLKSLVAK